MSTANTIETGRVMKYVGTNRGLNGMIVKITGPIRGDDEQPTGRYEIQQWIASEGRYSWVTADATAKDLVETPECSSPMYRRDDPTYATFVYVAPARPLDTLLRKNTIATV